MSKYKVFLIIPLIMNMFFCAGNVRQSEMNFANQLAERDLWEEAFLRWQKILDNGKPSPALYNNIAIAYEKMGKLTEAEESYKKALQLSPSNSYIKRNLEQLQKLLKGEPEKPEPDADKTKDKKEQRGQHENG